MEGLLILRDNVCVNFLLVNFAGQHSDDELVHGCVFVAFLETFKYFNSADENITRNNVPSEF